MGIVTFKKLAYVNMEANVKKCRDLNVGQEALRNNTYLPKYEGESEIGYKTRKNTSYLNNKFNDKIVTSCGLVLNKKIQYHEDTPEYIISDTNNAGESIDQFALMTLRNGQIDGHSFILIDSIKEKPISLKEQEDKKIHPYFINTQMSNLINWRFSDNNKYLTLAVISTINVNTDDEFEEVQEEVYNVYRLEENKVTIQTYKVDKSGNFVGGEISITSFKTIPIVPFYTNKESEFESTPPFLNVANNNINTFQLGSQKQRALKMIGDPDKAIFDDALSNALSNQNEEADTNVKEATLTFGADIVQVFGQDADYRYIEPTGKGVELLGEEIARIEKAIDGLGAELSDQTNTSATEAEISNTKATATDVVFSQNLEDALNQAFEILKEVDSSIPLDLINPFTLNRGFAKAQLPAQMITALNGAVLSGNMSKESFLKSISDGAVVRWKTQKEIDEELSKLELEPIE